MYGGAFIAAAVFVVSLLAGVCSGHIFFGRPLFFGWHFSQEERRNVGNNERRFVAASATKQHPVCKHWDRRSARKAMRGAVK